MFLAQITGKRCTFLGTWALRILCNYYLTEFFLNPFRAESVQNFGIFLNFNFPKNTFKYSKSHSHEGLQRDKTSKKSFILSLKIIWDSFYPLDPKI